MSTNNEIHVIYCNVKQWKNLPGIEDPDTNFFGSARQEWSSEDNEMSQEP